MHAELNNRPGEKRKSCSDVKGELAGLSVFVCSSSFPFVLCLRRSPAFSSVSSSLSLYWFYIFYPLFCSANPGAETGEGDGTAAFLPVFFSSLSLLLCSTFLFLFLFSQLTNRNSFCSLRFISTLSVLFSFFLLLSLFLLLLPASPWR